MADDIVDTIAQYDLDEDFPPYANDQNKELNQIVREKVRLVAQLGLEIEEHQERLKILEEHLKSVKMELVHTQSLVDAENKEGGGNAECCSGNFPNSSTGQDS